MATLTRRYHAKPPALDGFRLDRAALYAGIDHQPEDPANLLRIAIAFEQRAALRFETEAERLAEGSAERQLYRELAAEEREHLALLSTEYERWKQGKPGLL
jgi:hypothetical protein